MKEVEITEAGFIVTDRFFFKQKTIFFPFENIKRVKNKFWWLGNNKRITIEFVKPTEFGSEISFLGNSFSRIKLVKMVEELNQIVWEKKNAESLNPASSILNLN